MPTVLLILEILIGEGTHLELGFQATLKILYLSVWI